MDKLTKLIENVSNANSTLEEALQELLEGYAELMVDTNRLIKENEKMQETVKQNLIKIDKVCTK
jgi:predicted RNase H-like HicB family nuclease